MKQMNRCELITEKALQLVWEDTKLNPRDYLRALNALLRLAKDQQVSTIDETFVKPKISRILTSVRKEEDLSLFEDHRLA
jgi:cystathionine beta-lyase/cystathionine gamma-synthase